MKKSKSLISLLLLLSMLLSAFSHTAYAAEEEPVTDETPTPEQTVEPAPVEVTSLEELLSAIEAAEDGDTIYISKKIWINGETLITDKEITLKPSDSLTSEMIYVTQQGGKIQGFHFSENEKQRNTISIASGNNAENVLLIKDCIFDGNSVHSGSFLCNFAYLSIQLYNCSFINNMDFAVSLHGDNDIIDGCTFKNNMSILSGAAFTSGGNLQIRNSTITDNSSGIYNTGTMTMENCIIYGNTLDKESPCDIRNDRTLNIDTVADERSFYEKSTGVKVDVPMDAYQEMAWLFCFTDEEAQLYFSQSAEEIIPPSDDDLENEIDTTVPETPEEPDNAPAPIRPTRPVHIYRPSIEQKQEEEPEKLVLSYGGAMLDTSNPLVLLGYNDNQLHENDPITRAQIAVLLYRSLTAESKAVLSENTSIFADVESGVWYYDAVSALFSAGIINGCDGLFHPNDNLTWGQLVALLTRFVEPKTAAMPNGVTYSEHWAYENIVTAVVYGWIENAAAFTPDRIVTRAEAVDFVNSIFESCETAD